MTLGAALIMEDVADFLSLGTQYEKSVDLFLPTLIIGKVYLPSIKLVMFVLVLALIVALFDGFPLVVGLFSA